MTKAKKKNKVGRPKTLVKERIKKISFSFEKINKLAILGITDSQLADLLEVDERTINRWKKDAAFMSALKDGKEIADSRVVKALFERSIGFKQEEVYISSYRGQIKKTPYVKGYPPDPTSMIFWLKNRQPDLWREKQLIEQVTNTQEELRNMTDGELDKEISSMNYEWAKERNLKIVPITEE